MYPSLNFHSALVVALSMLGCLLAGCSGERDFERLPQDEQVELGVEYLRVFNFKSAYEVLSFVQPKLSASDEQWPLATYSLALAAWHRSPPSHEALLESERLYKSLIEQAPRSEFAASALLDLGRMAEIADFLDDDTDVDAAQAYYQRTIEEFPDSEMAIRAKIFLAQSMAQALETEQVRAAISLLEQEIEDHPDSPWVGVMAQYCAQLYALYLGDYGSSLAAYELAMEAGFPRKSETATSLWQYGLFAEEAGEDLLAADIFSRLVRNHPRSIYGTIARERVVGIAARNPAVEIEIPELKNIGLGR